MSRLSSNYAVSRKARPHPAPQPLKPICRERLCPPSAVAPRMTCPRLAVVLRRTGRALISPWACVSRRGGGGKGFGCSWVQGSPEWCIWVVGNHPAWSGLDGVSPYHSALPGDSLRRVGSLGL